MNGWEDPVVIGLGASVALALAFLGGMVVGVRLTARHAMSATLKRLATERDAGKIIDVLNQRRRNRRR